MLKYAFSHPGKIGDFLYILPTARYICERDGAIADIYTSEMCASTKKLVEFQSYVNEFIIPKDYKIQHFNMGVQPWKMPIDESKYDKVFQLGFQGPPHGPLHAWIAKTAGLDIIPPVTYDYPDLVNPDKPYIVLAHCGYHTLPNLKKAYEYFLLNSPITCAVVGIEGDRIHAQGGYYDLIGLDFLYLAGLISDAVAYVGFYSGQLAIANGFPGLLKVLTSSRSGGETEGLNIPITINLPSTTQGPQLLDTVMRNVDRKYGGSK